MSNHSNSVSWITIINKILGYVYYLFLFIFVILVSAILNEENNLQTRLLDIYLAVILLLAYIIFYYLGNRIYHTYSTNERDVAIIELLQKLIFYDIIGLGFIPLFSLIGKLSAILLISFNIILLIISILLSLTLKKQNIIYRLPNAIVTQTIIGFYLFVGPLYLLKYFIYICTADPIVVYKWLILLGGTMGFIIGCIFGNYRGSSKGPRTIITGSILPSFFVSMVVGFIIPWLTKVIENSTAFLPRIINISLWAFLFGIISGVIIGYWLGRSFIINIDYNRTPNVYHTAPSTIPSTIGAAIGIIIFVVLVYKP